MTGFWIRCVCQFRHSGMPYIPAFFQFADIKNIKLCHILCHSMDQNMLKSEQSQMPVTQDILKPDYITTAICDQTFPCRLKVLELEVFYPLFFQWSIPWSLYPLYNSKAQKSVASINYVTLYLRPGNHLFNTSTSFLYAPNFFVLLILLIL